MEPRSTTANEPHHPCPLHRLMKEAHVSCERDVVELCSDDNFLLRGPPVMPRPLMDMHSRGPISPLNIGSILDEMMDSAMHQAFEVPHPTLWLSPPVPEEESESEENAASAEEEERDAVDPPSPKVASVKLTRNQAITEEDKAVEAFDNMLFSLFTKVVAEERSSQSNSKSPDVAETVSVEGEAKNVEENIPEEADKKPEDFDASVWTNAVVEHGHEILGQQKNAETDNVDLNRRRLQDEPKREIRRRLAERLTEVPSDVLIFTEDGMIVFVGLPPPRMQGFIEPNYPTFIGLGPRTDNCLWDNLSTRSLSQACGTSLVNLHNTRSEMAQNRVAKLSAVESPPRGEIRVEKFQPWVEAYGLQLILVILLCVYYCCLQKTEETDPCVCCCCGMDSSQANGLEVDDACCTCCEGTGVCGPGCTSCCGDSANGGKPCDCCDGEDCDMCSGGATMYRSLPGYPGSRRTVAKPKTYDAAYTGVPIQIV
eukprot:scaffold22122_cov55-Attheya_sp.AAC.4